MSRFIKIREIGISALCGSILALVSSLAPAFAEDTGLYVGALTRASLSLKSAADNNPIVPSSSWTTERKRRVKALQADEEKAVALRPLIVRHAATHGVPADLADAMVRVESRYNPKARNGPNVGLTQINPLTARSLGYSGDAAGLYNPDTNLYYGIKYLAGAYKLANGNTCGTILRYQAGHRATRMTHAAQSYCSKVKAILASR
jgi:soluble lytic murein transglycosylase-like protein